MWRPLPAACKLAAQLQVGPAWVSGGRGALPLRLCRPRPAQNVQESKEQQTRNMCWEAYRSSWPHHRSHRHVSVSIAGCQPTSSPAVRQRRDPVAQRRLAARRETLARLKQANRSRATSSVRCCGRCVRCPRASAQHSPLSLLSDPSLFSPGAQPISSSGRPAGQSQSKLKGERPCKPWAPC